MSKVTKSLRRDVGKNVALNTRKRLKGGEKKLPERRNFMRFDATAKTAINYPMPFSIDGGFEIEFYYYFTQASINMGFFALYTDIDTEYLYGKYNKVGNMKLQSDGATPSEGATNYDDGKPHKVVFKFDAQGNYQVFVDDFLEYEDFHRKMETHVNGKMYKLIVGAVKAWEGASVFGYAEGYIWDFKLWTGGDRETGTLLIDAPLDNSAILGHNNAYKPEPLTRQELAPPYHTVSNRIGSTGGSTILSAVNGKIKILRKNTNSSWLLRYRDTYQAGFYEARIFVEPGDWVGTLGVLAYSHDQNESIEQAQPFREGERFARIVFEAQNGEDISVILSGNAQAEDIGKVVRITNIEIRPLSQPLGKLINFVESDSIRMTKEGDRWCSENLSSITSTELLGDDANPEFASTMYTLAAGHNYTIGARFTAFTGSGNAGFAKSADMPDESPFRKTEGSVGDLVGGDLIVAQGTPVVLFGRSTSVVSYDDITIREYIEPPKQPKSRNFMKFDDTANASVQLSAPVGVGTDGFEMHVKIYPYDVGGTKTILSGEAQSSNGVYIDINGGKIRAFCYSGGTLQPVLTSRSDAAPNVMTEVSLLVSSNGDAGLYINGVKESSGTWSITGAENINNLGMRPNGSSSHFVGVICDFVMTKGGDVVVNMPLDDSLKHGLIENKAATLTDITNPPYITAQSEGTFTSNSDGSFTVSNVTDTSYGPTWNGTIDHTKSYIVEFDVTEIVGKLLLHRWSDGWAGSKISSELIESTGHYRIPLIDTDVFRFRCISSDTNPDSMFTVKNLRIYESDKCQAFGKNFIESDVEFFTFWKEGKYLGPELVTQDVWENPAVSPAIFSYEPDTNTWFMDGDGGYSSLALLSSYNQPPIMRVAGVISDIVGQGLVLASNSSPSVRHDGFYEEVIDLETMNSQGFKRSQGVVDARIHKPSIREILELK